MATGAAGAGAETRIGVLFDLDGLLVDTESLYHRAYGAVLAEYGHSVDAETYSRHWIQDGTGAEWAVGAFGLPMTPAELKERKEPHYRRLLETELRALPGAADCVRRLSAVFPCALATNSYRRNVDLAMDVLGVRSCFRDIVTRERFARPKPSPDAFLAGAAALGLPPERCVVLEDAEKGLIAARAAGTRCIIVPCALTRSGDFRTADARFDHLDAVTPDIVSALFR